jgi:anaerobic sulfite reductase subunit B
VRSDPSVTTLIPTMATVEAVRRELDDTVTLSLSLPEPGELPTPGQFAMLWAPGVGEVAISYSGIRDGGRVDHTIRDVGATTHALVNLEPGAQLGTRGPFGRGWDLTRTGGRRLIIVAGGLGLAPLRPVVEAATAGTLDTASTQLVVGARDPDAILYRSEISTIWSSLRPTLTVDHASDRWRGRVGPVTVAIPSAIEDPATVEAIVCGPEIMMRVVARELMDRGVSPDSIQVSLERNMQCGVARCGHCQLGSLFTCVDAPVLGWDEAEPLLAVRQR